MPAHTFRFDHAQSQFRVYQSRVRHAFEPRKPRHRLLRFAFGVIGLGLLVLLVMFSVFVGAAMIAAGLLYRLWAGRGKPTIARAAADARVVEGEYRLVDPAVPGHSVLDHPLQAAAKPDSDRR
ncbi:MAG: hypothetical protein M3374_00100 [Pseudomonadota bacterium]|nr:hypothetical protein [Pseudomonadota bacterium]